MPLPKDYTIDKLIEKIYKENNGKVSKEAIFAIIDFQSFTVRKGMEEGDDIRLKYLGIFKFNHKYAYKFQQEGVKVGIQTEQVIEKPEGSKSHKVREVRRIVFKKR